MNEFKSLFSCPTGLQMTANRLGCEDKNECDWQPCGRGGRCFNVESGGGYWCDCPLDGFRCDNCSCEDGPYIKHSGQVGLGSDALAIIIFCLVFYLSKSLFTHFVINIQFYQIFKQLIAFDIRLE